MSSTSTYSQYSIQHSVIQGSSGGQDSSNFTLTLPDWTDAAVGAFVQALEALPLPAGCTSQVSVSKSTQTTVIYETDTATTPVTFT